MAIVRKNSSVAASTFSDESAKSSGQSAREAEMLRKRARTMGKQQQAAERIAAATGELSSGINQAASAAEELKAAADQIAAGAEIASGAAQESTAAFRLVVDSIARQLTSADSSQAKAESSEALVARTSNDVGSLVASVTIAGQRQLASVDMVVELEK